MAQISVIIPNYNRASIIGDTVQNMLNQSLPPDEVIVVDDGSTDDSVTVLKSFGDRITLIEQENQGAGAARNAGLKVASGEFIQFMDSDDLASVNKLEVQAKTLIEQKADIVYGPWLKAYFKGKNLQLQDVVLQQKPLPSERSPLLWFLISWSIVFQQCLVRKSILDKVEGYREDMPLYQDLELFARLLVAGSKLVYESDSLTLYRLEDHGKLTGSGCKKEVKIIDTARFYALVINLLNDSAQFKAYLSNPEFHLNVGVALTELKQLNSPPREILNSLEQFCQQDSLLWVRIKNWLRQKQKGLQYRVKGHRWPYSYQTDTLTLPQKTLIKDLGYNFKAKDRRLID